MYTSHATGIPNDPTSLPASHTHTDPTAADSPGSAGKMIQTAQSVDAASTAANGRALGLSERTATRSGYPSAATAATPVTTVTVVDTVLTCVHSRSRWRRNRDPRLVSLSHSHGGRQELVHRQTISEPETDTEHLNSR